MNKPLTHKGQIIIAIIGAVAAISASIMTAASTVAGKTADIDKRVDLVSQREELHYTELKGLLMSIDSKLDKIAPATVTTKAEK
jgi:hypothetical protein